MRSTSSCADRGPIAEVITPKSRSGRLGGIFIDKCLIAAEDDPADFLGNPGACK